MSADDNTRTLSGPASGSCNVGYSAQAQQKQPRHLFPNRRRRSMLSPVLASVYPDLRAIAPRRYRAYLAAGAAAASGSDFMPSAERITRSTRRLWARPSSVSLVSEGTFSA